MGGRYVIQVHFRNPERNAVGVRKLEIDITVDSRKHAGGGKIAVENYGRGILYVCVVESDGAVGLEFAQTIAVENHVGLGSYRPRLVGAYGACAVIALVYIHPVVRPFGEELKQEGVAGRIVS